MTEISNSGCYKCKATIADLRSQLAKLSLVAEEQTRSQLETAELYSISPWALAVKRVPALILTMALELIGGVVIDQLHRVTFYIVIT